jgi:hypothetical protein
VFRLVFIVESHVEYNEATLINEGEASGADTKQLRINIGFGIDILRICLHNKRITRANHNR